MSTTNSPRVGRDLVAFTLWPAPDDGREGSSGREVGVLRRAHRWVSHVTVKVWVRIGKYETRRE